MYWSVFEIDISNDTFIIIRTVERAGAECSRPGNFWRPPGFKILKF